MAKKEAPVLGIDLGTSTSLACVMHEDERLEVITPDTHYASDLLPSVFCWTDDGARVGKAAEDLLKFQKHRDSVIRCVKREMKHPARTFTSGGVRYSPVQISGFLLRRLREAAEDQLGLARGAITRAVITVPAHFGQIERKATRKAGEEEAGFDEVHLLDEPIAAAIGMRLKTRLASEKLVLVFDLGGGTLDVTLLKVGNRLRGGFLELGRDGHDELGGVNWDEVIARDVVFQHDSKHAGGYRRDPEFFNLNNIRLYEPCEEAKKDFSHHEALDQVLVSYWDQQLESPVDSAVTRQRYNEQTAYLAEACASICDRLLQCIHPEDLANVRRKGFGGLLGTRNQAPIGWADVDEVFLVGGGSKVRSVRDKLEQRWGRPPTLSEKPQHQVAYGAAIVAAALGKEGAAMQQGMLLRSPHTYGYYAPHNGKEQFFPIIHKNASVPRKEEVVCGVGGAGSVFHIQIVEERFDLHLLSGKMTTKHDVVKRLQAKVPPKRSENSQETATLRLDYRNDREITFDVTFREQDIIKGERIHHGDEE